jgi:hypothetical protein
MMSILLLSKSLDRDAFPWARTGLLARFHDLARLAHVPLAAVDPPARAAAAFSKRTVVAYAEVLQRPLAILAVGPRIRAAAHIRMCRRFTAPFFLPAFLLWRLLALTALLLPSFLLCWLFRFSLSPCGFACHGIILLSVAF